MSNWHPALSYHIQNYSPLPMFIEDVTQVLTFKNNIEGTEIRILLSNEYNRDCLKIEAIKIHTGQGTSALTVGGKTAITLRPNEKIYTDNLKMSLAAGAPIQISIYVKNHCLIEGYAGMNSSKGCLAAFYPGSWTGAQKPLQAAELSAAVQKKFNRYVYFAIGGIEVLSEQPVKTITLFGDSLVHQACWGNALNHRLMKCQPNVVVINEGISGNRVLTDNHAASHYNPIFGKAGLNRFQQDVYDRFQPDWVIIAEGINDLVHPGSICEIDELPDCDALIKGLKRLAEIAAANGSRTALCTLSPFYNYDGVWNEKKEQIRNQVNSWIRQQETTDCIIDIDAFVRDEEDYRKLKTPFDSGDHLHFNLTGGNYIAEKIMIEQFL